MLARSVLHLEWACVYGCMFFAWAWIFSFFICNIYMMNAIYVNNCARTIVIFVLSASFRLNPIPVQGVHFIYVYSFFYNPLKLLTWFITIQNALHFFLNASNKEYQNQSIIISNLFSLSLFFFLFFYPCSTHLLHFGVLYTTDWRFLGEHVLACVFSAGKYIAMCIIWLLNSHPRIDFNLMWHRQQQQ